MAPPKKNRKFTVDEQGVKWYECDNCDFKTKYAGTIATHNKKEHCEILVRYTCGACGYDFKDKEFLKQHVVRIYANPEDIVGYIVCKDHATSN